MTAAAASQIAADGVNPTGTASVLRRFASDRFALVCLIILGAALVVSIAVGLIAPGLANQTSSGILQGPTALHPLGTDELGRDIGMRLLVGAQSSLLVAFGSALLALVIGVAVGVVAGYFGGIVDAIAMRVMDLLLAVPILLIALVVVVVLGPSSVNVIIAIAVANLPVFAMLARASTLEVRGLEYVAASRSMGAGNLDIMGRTVLPNILGPLIVQFIVAAASAIVVEASLSFLGLGVPPPAPSWGAMLQQSQSYLYDNPWYGVFPGLALAVTVLLLDRVGRGLQFGFGGSQSTVVAR